jgi:hypothetical protein
MAMKTYRIGMVGLDTSHVTAFASLLHESSHEYHVPGGRIVAAYPGGSPDFDLSANRVAAFTDELRDKYAVEIVDSISALRGKCDAIMLESIDGRVHLPQFREVAEWGIPVFIDKPLALSRDEAQEMANLAAEKGVRVTSASAIRFAEKFQAALAAGGEDPVTGGDFFGPMHFVEKCPGYFWYGIHSAEMLFAVMGAGCREVLATREDKQDVLVGRWSDGRLGTVRGNRTGNNGFGGVIHCASKSISFDVSDGKKPYYASLLEKVIPFFHGEGEVVAPVEMVEVIAFLEAANRSADSRQWVEVLSPRA